MRWQASFAVALGRRGQAAAGGRVLPTAAATLALQALHVAEEFATGFHVVGPRAIGLPSWPPEMFVSVNLAAIAVWCMVLRIFALGRSSLLPTALLWFLALMGMGHAVIHAGLSIMNRAYYPGTITGVLLGIAGFLLAACLSGRGRST